jgi:outer membrane protein assembly factor BamB
VGSGKIKQSLAVILILIVAFSSLALSRTGVTFAQQSFNKGDPLAAASQLWNYTLDNAYAFSPVAENGFIYINTGFGALSCINASTGTLTWSHNATLFGGFTVANGFIYVSQDLPATIYCLNASSGAQLWNYTYGTSSSFGTPLLAKGVLYVGGFYNLVGTAFAFNALTGEQMWNFSGPEGTRFDETAVVLAGTILYAASDYPGVVYALNAATGGELWNCTTKGQSISLTTGNSDIYVGVNFLNNTNPSMSPPGNVIALDAESGALIWNFTAASGSVDSPVFGSNNLYLFSSSGFVYTLDASNGAIIWNYTFGSSPASDSTFGPAVIEPILAGGYLYQGSPAGVFCFNANNGKVVWNFKPSDFTDSYYTYPTLDNGAIYVGYNGPLYNANVTQHHFYALDASNGAAFWNYTFGYAVLSPPTVVNDSIYMIAVPITSLSSSFEGTAIVLALNSMISKGFSPMPPPSTKPYPSSTTSPPPKLFITSPLVIGVLAVVVVVVAVTFLALRKRVKTKPTSQLGEEGQH